MQQIQSYRCCQSSLHATQTSTSSTHTIQNCDHSHIPLFAFQLCQLFQMFEWFKFRAPLHYAALPIKRCQLENWARFSPQPPFSWALIISDKIFGFQSLSSFTFKIYLGPSSSFPPIFMCFNYFRQSSNTLCECLEDQLNVALKSRLQIFLMI